MSLAPFIMGQKNRFHPLTTQRISVPYTLHSKTAESAVARTKTKRDNISSPEQGQIVFCTDCGDEG